MSQPVGQSGHQGRSNRPRSEQRIQGDPQNHYGDQHRQSRQNGQHDTQRRQQQDNRRVHSVQSHQSGNTGQPRQRTQPSVAPVADYEPPRSVPVPAPNTAEVKSSVVPQENDTVVPTYSQAEKESREQMTRLLTHLHTVDDQFYTYISNNQRFLHQLRNLPDVLSFFSRQPDLLRRFFVLVANTIDFVSLYDLSQPPQHSFLGQFPEPNTKPEQRPVAPVPVQPRVTQVPIPVQRPVPVPEGSVEVSGPKHAPMTRESAAVDSHRLHQPRQQTAPQRTVPQAQAQQRPKAKEPKGVESLLTSTQIPQHLSVSSGEILVTLQKFVDDSMVEGRGKMPVQLTGGKVVSVLKFTNPQLEKQYNQKCQELLEENRERGKMPFSKDLRTALTEFASSQHLNEGVHENILFFSVTTHTRDTSRPCLPLDIIARVAQGGLGFLEGYNDSMHGIALYDSFNMAWSRSRDLSAGRDEGHNVGNALRRTIDENAKFDPLTTRIVVVCRACLGKCPEAFLSQCGSIQGVSAVVTDHREERCREIVCGSKQIRPLYAVLFQAPPVKSSQ